MPKLRTKARRHPACALLSHFASRLVGQKYYGGRVVETSRNENSVRHRPPHANELGRLAALAFLHPGRSKARVASGAKAGAEASAGYRRRRRPARAVTF